LGISRIILIKLLTLCCWWEFPHPWICHDQTKNININCIQNLYDQQKMI